MKIGFLGTGLMGLPMAQKLLEANHIVTAYNRTQSKLEPLQKAGAKIANSPAEAIQSSECLILMLTNYEAIKNVLLSDSSKAELSGRTVIQMGTISPTESKEIRDEVVACGGEYLEAPVLGSIPQVKSGSLIVMVGASSEQYEKWCGLLKIFGPEPLHIGAVGSGAAIKLAMNQLIGSLTTAFALSLGLIVREGINVDLFMQIVRDSALYAPTFDKKLQRMLDRNYENPNFPAKHLLKDTNIFINATESLGLDVSIQEGVRKVLEKTIELGLSDVDYSALFSAVNPNN
ncbi:MAG: NAD(P)-dependent oxidoreductase [Okeania sp. SIO2C9]|uniref:NAD(P)-dependent oxidoreductase n=1 Tax=Okeania sp. SIO2C9 TaxID=2607791 RepID=UPI0013C21610|nr:NAD(P)-dependent oxidoreductase [Okeania sp. SIO2C9]NEQ75912.1 NAD(P)-dependent oxidoreductase [Okeania sp. SIO2C9]